VPLPLHVDPLLKAEIQRIAEAEGLSVSQVGATGLGEWVHQRLHDHHEALLYPVLRQLIRDELRAFGNRIVFFLIRIAFAAEQSRILITNVLHKLTIQMGVPIDKFNELVDKSNKMARRNIIARSPEIKKLMQEWEASRDDEKEDDKTNSSGKEKK
jgi:protein-disulfide isomerase-like protein with CxxC motif